MPWTTQTDLSLTPSCNSAWFGLFRTQILGRYDEEWVHPVPLFFVNGRSLETG
jgi:hypothetical protein